MIRYITAISCFLFLSLPSCDDGELADHLKIGIVQSITDTVVDAIITLSFLGDIINGG